MAKYINADELLKRLNACKYLAEKITNRQAAYNAAISDTCRSIDAMPAADVVEVVRCRECKHYAPIDPSLPTICEYMTGEVVGDNYCSYGERRNE